MKRSQIGNELCLQVLSFSLWTLTFHAVKDCTSTQLKELHWAREPFICTWNLLGLFLSSNKGKYLKCYLMLGTNLHAWGRLEKMTRHKKRRRWDNKRREQVEKTREEEKCRVDGGRCEFTSADLPSFEVITAWLGTLRAG